MSIVCARCDYQGSVHGGPLIEPVDCHCRCHLREVKHVPTNWEWRWRTQPAEIGPDLLYNRVHYTPLAAQPASYQVIEANARSREKAQRDLELLQNPLNHGFLTTDQARELRELLGQR